MAKRVQSSFGQTIVNEGTTIVLPYEKYVLDNTRAYIIFDVIPMGAVRMTKSDTWKLNPFHKDPAKRQRPAVTKYFEFKNLLIMCAKKINFELGKYIDAVYLIPMPASWSDKKKKLMNGMPCEVKPDTDNITKAIKDTLRKEDSDIWWEKAEKRWAYKGSIIIFK